MCEQEQTPAPEWGLPDAPECASKNTSMGQQESWILERGILEHTEQVFKRASV